MNQNGIKSVVTFYRLIPNARPPQRADRSAGGTLPTRAYRYCEAIRTASAFGWYIFPPLNFSLLWDGNDIVWRYSEQDEWNNLTSAQYPGFLDVFNSNAPEELLDCAPPLLGKLEEPGLVQIWSGLFAKTKQDWSLLVRAPANISSSLKYQNYEGIVETDKWFGPLFTNIRLTKTDVPIEFDSNRPLMQVQPLHRSTYADDILGGCEIIDSLESMTETDWELYRKTLIDPGKGHDREKGFYAKKVRRKEE